MNAKFIHLQSTSAWWIIPFTGNLNSAHAAPYSGPSFWVLIMSLLFSLFSLTFPKSGKKKFLPSPSQCPCLRSWTEYGCRGTSWSAGVTCPSLPRQSQAALSVLALAITTVNLFIGWVQLWGIWICFCAVIKYLQLISSQVLVIDTKSLLITRKRHCSQRGGGDWFKNK